MDQRIDKMKTWRAGHLHEVHRTNFSGADEADSDGFFLSGALLEFYEEIQPLSRHPEWRQRRDRHNLGHAILPR